MMTWNRICCAISASGPSRSALRHAVELAGRAGAALHVVHVVPGTGVGYAPFAPPPSPRRTRAAPRELAAWIADAQARLPDLVVSVERHGEPAKEIVRYAREWDCDVIVLGARSRRGIGRLVLGSVADSVTRDAPCPVLLVPGEERAGEATTGRSPPLGAEPTGLP